VLNSNCEIQVPSGRLETRITKPLFYQYEYIPTMSFGFGAGEIITVGTLVWNVYTAYASAPEQFRNFSQEILSLHVVIRKVEDHLGISGTGGQAAGSQLRDSGGVACLSTNDKNDLKILYDGLQMTMKELEDLLQKYQSLTAKRNFMHRLRWGQEDLVGLRDKLRSNIALLTAFNTTLAK